MTSMKTALLIVSLCLTVVVQAQQTVEEYVRTGIEQHDAGEYEQAIASYKKALELDSKSLLAHYEIAMTYLYAQQYDLCLKHADVVLKQKGEHQMSAYVTKGNCLDAMGKADEAIKTYKKGIKKTGGGYLLFYNMGLTYFNQNEMDQAETALLTALEDNAAHASSHLVLGHVMRSKRQKVQSMLSFYYFLLLEPNSGRSAGALKLLTEQFTENVTQTGPTSLNIVLNMSALNEDNEFSAAELMIPMIIATNNTDENRGKTPEELFVKNTQSLLEFLGESRKETSKGLWWELQIPLLYEIAKTEHIEAFCYYILQSGDNGAAAWLEGNQDKLAKFAAWIQE